MGRRGVLKALKGDYEILQTLGDVGDQCIVFDHKSTLRLEDFSGIQKEDDEIKIIYVPLKGEIICSMNGKRCNLEDYPDYEESS